MTQYNTLNVTLCSSQLNKLKSAIKNGIKLIKIKSRKVSGQSTLFND